MDPADLWGDPDDDSEAAFLERLRRVRAYLARLIGDYDAAIGFTRPAELAAPSVLSILDAIIAAEEESSQPSGAQEDAEPPEDRPRLRPVE